MTVAQKLTTWQVLRGKFPENEYVLIEEVSDASGFQRSRSLDFMVINLWQSRGLAIIGIERKSNRGDWLKELKQPQKQENHFKYCDYFYLLTDKENVAKIEEIPETWGWYHINGNQTLKTIKAAPKLNPLPIERSLLCAMLRRAADKEKYVHTDTLDSHITEKAEKIQTQKNYTLERESLLYKELKEKVDAFELASGLNIQHTWGSQTSKKIGEAVKVILSEGTESHVKNIQRISQQVKGIYDTMINNLDILNNYQQ